MFDDTNGGMGTRGCIDLLAARLGRTTGMIHAEIRALHGYYERLRAGRDVPRRAEVDPRDMHCAASNLFILEDLGGARLRFRLAGTALASAFGRELRGADAREMMEGRARESFAALVQEALAEPGIGYCRLWEADRPAGAWEMLLLPLRSEGGAIDRLLGGLLRLDRAGPPSPGMRLRIEEMNIRPLAHTPAPGFAEAQRPFSGAPAAPRLRPIEGGRRDAAPSEERPRAHLRLVRDE